MNMKNIVSVSLDEVLTAFQHFDGIATSFQIQNFVIAFRKDHSIPSEYGNERIYRDTINQRIQQYCPTDKNKYRGYPLFRRIRNGLYELIGNKVDFEQASVESREFDSYRKGGHPEISLERFEQMLKECKTIGEKGERHVLRAEKKRLKKDGRLDLAKKVTRVSLKSVGAGYDILSFDKDGKERFIEVKASKKTNPRFYLTANEYETAKKLKGQYWLYRVHNCQSKPSILPFRNPAKILSQGKWRKQAISYSIDCGIL
jgi:hypothetical protein